MKQANAFLLFAFGLFVLMFLGQVFEDKPDTESMPHYFIYTVIDLKGDTISGNAWVPSATCDLQVKNVGGASCLVAVYGNRQDIVLCNVKKILR